MTWASELLKKKCKHCNYELEYCTKMWTESGYDHKFISFIDVNYQCDNPEPKEVQGK